MGVIKTKHCICILFLSISFLCTFVFLLTKEHIGIPNLDSDFERANKKLCHGHIEFNGEAEQMFKFLEQSRSGICSDLQSIGGRIFKSTFLDGNKIVCLDSGFEFARNSCTVLSFGVGMDLTFDFHMIRHFGCTVFSFDPTSPKQIDAEAKKNDKLHFYRIGISNYDGMLDIGGILAKVDRYEGLIYRMNLQDTTIDYLKMDIEGSEMNAFEDIFSSSFYLLKKVKQIGMEIHLSYDRSDIINWAPPAKEMVRRQWSIMQNLKCAGFELASVQMNTMQGNHLTLNGRTVSVANELLWIRRT